MTTPDLKAQIMRRDARAAPRKVWTPVDFLDLDAVDKALQRLVSSDDLRRIDRGLYDKPSFNSLTRQPTAPDPRQVIDAFARRDQIRVLVYGMTAANDLGLTNAAPSRIVVHTDARLSVSEATMCSTGGLGIDRLEGGADQDVFAFATAFSG